MKIISYPLLLSVTIWLFCGSAFVWSQNQDATQQPLIEILKAMKHYNTGQYSKEEAEQSWRDARMAWETETSKPSPLQESMTDERKHQFNIINTMDFLREDLKLPSSQIFVGIDFTSKEIDHSILGTYPPTPTDIRYGSELEAQGDYSKLKLIIRSRKQDYNPGEHIYVKFFVRNDSDSEVHVSSRGFIRYAAPYWKLFRSDDDEVAKTPKWEKESKEHTQWGRLSLGLGWKEVFNYMKLQPGKEHELDWICMNDYFDLSKPDTYKLTCIQLSFITGQYYEPPLQSNTLTFRIIEPSGEEPIYVKESPDVPYTNPLPGEEVFKQPQPPKNVFYVIDNKRPRRKIIDVSPTEYFRQWAKEQEAQAAKPPDEAQPLAE